MLPLGLLGWVDDVIQWTLIIIGIALIVMTLLSQTDWATAYARMWDFPRVQIAALALVTAVAYAVFFARSGAGWSFVLVVLLVVALQLYRIYPYTPLAGKQVRATTSDPDPSRTIRVVMTNVLTPNRDIERWRESIVPADPDLLVAVETDEWWLDRIRETFGETHNQEVAEPLDNLYGIAVLSRLPMQANVEYWVQDDIPSVHGTVKLKDGSPLQFHAVHPRPPMPGEFHSSAPRDAELVLLGQKIREARQHGEKKPTLVVGDLNDVAWSETTRLFIRLSGLLDPRRGRGMFNTFHADYPPIRFPLDHGFFSQDLRLVEMKRLPHTGSDHFPVLFVLEYDPAAADDQDRAQRKAGDEEKAKSKLDEEAARTD